MITKTDLKEVDPVILTKALLEFNNIVRKEIIEKDDKLCTDHLMKIRAERKSEIV